MLHHIDSSIVGLVVFFLAIVASLLPPFSLSFSTYPPSASLFSFDPASHPVRCLCSTSFRLLFFPWLCAGDLLWPNFLDHWPLPLPLHLLLPRRLTPCGHNHRPPPVARHMRTAAPRRRSSTPLSLTLSLAPSFCILHLDFCLPDPSFLPPPPPHSNVVRQSLLLEPKAC